MNQCTSQGCTTCCGILARWCAPLSSTKFTDFTGLIPERVFKWSNEDQKWAMSISRLKDLSKDCRFCHFLLETLDSSPWMAYHDEDYIELKTSSIGMTHISKPEMGIGFPSGEPAPKSSFEKIYRPRLQLFKAQPWKSKLQYAPDAHLFILPITKPTSYVRGASIGQVFQGRPVKKTVDIDLLKYWFETCQSYHIKMNMVALRFPRVESCEPARRHRIPNFRLIDLLEKRIVVAENQDYVILSYVWGDATRFLLRRENVEELSMPGSLSLDDQRLPKTFRDMMTLVESLGLRYVWIDALCIVQDDAEQLDGHMNVMDLIYSCAVLTIVSNTASADTGIPGVGYSRKTAQTRFQLGDQQFISSTKALDKSLRGSAWESRAWCLQERLFSKRRLTFMDTQAFYYCSCEKWSEDIVMEISEYPGGFVEASPGPTDMTSKSHNPCGRLLDTKLPAIIQHYSQRDLSFESDAIRAISGILRSKEEEFGPAIWGVPQKMLKQGLTWAYYPHDVTLRRHDFPSWSWAGWAGNKGSRLHFHSVQDYSSHLWDLKWYYHRVNSSGSTEIALAESPAIRGWNDWTENRWMIPGHPGEPDFVEHEISALCYDTMHVPPVLHVLQFYTSVAILFIEGDVADRKAPQQASNQPHALRDHRLLIPGSMKPIATITLDARWTGAGKLATFIYISREHSRVPLDSRPHDPETDRLNIMLVEGEGEVKTRVAMALAFNLGSWRETNPAWKLVSLA